MECTHLKPTKLPSILACIVAIFLKLLFTVWELRPYRIIELTSSCCNIWYNCEITIRESLMPIIATALQNYLCASLHWLATNWVNCTLLSFNFVARRHTESKLSVVLHIDEIPLDCIVIHWTKLMLSILGRQGIDWGFTNSLITQFHFCWPAFSNINNNTLYELECKFEGR